MTTLGLTEKRLGRWHADKKRSSFGCWRVRRATSSWDKLMLVGDLTTLSSRRGIKFASGHHYEHRDPATSQRDWKLRFTLLCIDLIGVVQHV